jgi:putative ABC transport system ATP-binding protein
VLCVEGVWKAFDRGRGRVWVLRDVSLEVGAGELGAVVGGRGQGKTTLIAVVSGMLAVDRGSVWLGGRELTGLSGRELRGVLASEVGIAVRSGPDARLSVRDRVAMSLNAARRLGGREGRVVVDAMLERLGLDGVAGAMWDELSDWERVLSELAQAVVRRPSLLLVDDLVDGHSLDHKRALMDLLEAFAGEMGCAVLMAVSDHQAALRSATVWSLSEGCLDLMHKDPQITYLHPPGHRGEATF